MARTVVPEVPTVDPSRSVAPSREAQAEYPDAVWVCVVSPTYDDADSPEARQAAVRYAADRYGAIGGIESSQGPTVDDGRTKPFQPTAGQAMSEGVTSAEEYRHQAAMRQMATSARSGPVAFVTYYRIRRPDAIVG